MSSLFRRGDVWVGKWKDHRGVWRQRRLGTNKEIAQAILHDLERSAEAQQALDAQLSWNQTNELLAGYRQELILRGCSQRYVNEMMTFLCTLVGVSNATEVQGLSSAKLVEYLGRLRERGLAPSTLNRYLRQAKAFAAWLVLNDHLKKSPYVSIRRLKEKESDRRLKRRAMTDEEVTRLMISLRPGHPCRKTVFDMHSASRQIIYQLALGTGFRAKEVASLTRESIGGIALADPFIALSASATKNGLSVRQPISTRLAADLRAWMAFLNSPTELTLISLPSSVPLFPGWDYTRAGAMLKEDLESAGVECVNDSGALDFHALRHTYITNLVLHGVDSFRVQKLARHSDISITAKYYTHLDEGHLADSVRNLPF